MSDGDDWPVCWCSLSPGYGHLWAPGHCPKRPLPKDRARPASTYWIGPDTDGVPAYWRDNGDLIEVLIREDQVTREVWAALKVGVHHV